MTVRLMNPIVHSSRFRLSLDGVWHPIAFAAEGLARAVRLPPAIHHRAVVAQPGVPVIRRGHFGMREKGAEWR